LEGGEVSEMSREEVSAMFRLLSQLGESGELEESVVQTIESMIASKSTAVKEVYNKFRNSAGEEGKAEFSSSLKAMAAAVVA